MTLPIHKFIVLLNAPTVRIKLNIPLNTDGCHLDDLGPAFETFSEAQEWLRQRRIEAVDAGVRTELEFAPWLRNYLHPKPKKREKLIKTCEHCKYFAQVLLRGGYCQNPKVEELVADHDGMPATFDKTFGCIFWTKKE